MTKQALREIYKNKRLAISSKEKLRLDDLLLLQFQQLYFSTDVNCVLTYWPIATFNEPNTHLFSSYLRHTIPTVHLAYPTTNFAHNTMDAVLINEDTVYTTNTKGLTEPKEGLIVPPHDIDIILVPLLICNKQGYRVGYGKGFYDKFLSQCREDAVKIGINYFEPVDTIEDIHAFDIPLNYYLTPASIYEF